MPRGARSGQSLDISIHGANELARLAKAMKGMEGGKELRKEFGKALRAETKPLVEDLKKSVSTLPSKGLVSSGHTARANVGKRTRKTGTGLRASIARAISAKVTYSGRSTGVRIIVDSRKLPEDQRGLPRAMNRGHWRHPTFGGDPWVEQSNRPGWFDDVIKKRSDDMRRALIKVMDDYAKKIDRI